MDDFRHAERGSTRRSTPEAIELADATPRLRTFTISQKIDQVATQNQERLLVFERGKPFIDPSPNGSATMSQGAGSFVDGVVVVALDRSPVRFSGH